MSMTPRRPRSAALAALALLVGAALLPAPVAAQTDAVTFVVFGDSLSDPGNGFALLRENATPPDYRMSGLLIPDAPYARGGHHLTNGATWIELLGRSLGASRSVLPAYQSDNPHAMNFAIGTARARNDGSLTSLPTQVAAFLQKTGGTAPSDAIYVIQVGGNDVRDALQAGGVAGQMILAQAVLSIKAAVETLAAAGARTFLVWNVPNVALTPTVRLLDTLQPGTAFLAEMATTGFNLALAAALAPLPAQLGISIAAFDANDLITTIVNNPAGFGLTHVTNACVTPDVAPFTCQDPDRFLFWDGIHPTAAAHAIIAARVLSLFQP
jgi:phospholipase/lecithinase/hemolysin